MNNYYKEMAFFFNELRLYLCEHFEIVSYFFGNGLFLYNISNSWFR